MTTEPEVMPPETAVAVREQNLSVGRAMSLPELHEQLQFIRNLMQQEMKEGQDYGKVPGCGDKPCLLQPGAQKLLMTFQLMNEVKEEQVNNFPGMHREYSITIRLRSATGRTWEGVGTCSTLEAKYRYRNSSRKCPKCGKETILKSKNPGEGWFCWAKRGGCGEKFIANDPSIVNQETGRVEHDNPPDYWNTVRKMAFKRALVHAAINATNTSELWTQDIEEAVNEEVPESPHKPSERSGGYQDTIPAGKTPNSPNLAAGKGIPEVGPNHLKRMVALLEPLREQATEWMRKISWLMPNEVLEDLPKQHWPVTKSDMDAIMAAVQDFVDGLPAQKPGEQIEVPRSTKPEAGEVPDEPWADVIVPVPHKGEKRDEYLKHPDTIGSLYAARHEDGDARQRLFGFVTHYQPKGWTKRDGTEMPPSEADIKFREALDQFADWFQKQHPDEKL